MVESISKQLLGGKCLPALLPRGELKVIVSHVDQPPPVIPAVLHTYNIRDSREFEALREKIANALGGAENSVRNLQKSYGNWENCVQNCHEHSEEFRKSSQHPCEPCQPDQRRALSKDTIEGLAKCDCGTRENARMITAHLQSLMCWCAETMTLVNQQRSLVDTCLVYADPCGQPPPCATVRQEKATGVEQPCHAFEETQTTQSRKMDDEAPLLRQATERDIEGLRELFQLERQKADAELAEARREIAAQVEQSRRADDEAARLKQATERDIEELRQLLQQEHQRIDTELAEARREIETRDAQLRQVTEQEIAELQLSLQQEREKTAILEKKAGRRARGK